MEKRIFDEITAKIDALQCELDALREKVSSLMAEPAASAFTEPVDIMLDDAAPVAPEQESPKAPVPEPEPVPESEPDPAPVPEPEPVPVPEPEPIPVPEPVAEPEPVSEPEPVPVPEPAAVRTRPDYAWARDIPGNPVSNIISGISLNDRVLLINTLFQEDPILFQKTIAAFNSMSSLNEAYDYILASFPKWNLGSDIVYRLMMAVRRKLD